MNLQRSTRRNAITAAALLFIFAAGTNGPATAAATETAAVAEVSPDTMILNLSTEVLDAIRGDKAIQAGDFDRVQKLVNERILPKVDFDKMTRLAVGHAWRTATAEQRAALTEQFRVLLMRTYSGAVSKVSDQKVRLRPSHDHDDAKDVIVRTQVVPSQGDPISLEYRLEKTDTGWKIYDINILGVWLVENYKTEFAQSLNQGGVDNLIQVLTQKNQKLAAAAKS
jgi:phospholipid transport system substrate-binding protein